MTLKNKEVEAEVADSQLVGGSAQPQDDAGSSAVPALRLRRSNEIDSDEEAEGA